MVDSNPVARIAHILCGKTLCLFCGAGTSFHSGIPLADQFIQAILDLLGLKDNEKQDFLAAKLPFESIVEILLETTGSELLFQVYRGATPNRNHIFFAELAKRKVISSIITTNFDALIETCLAEHGIPFRTYYSDDEFSSLRLTSEPLPIIKLHGDIDDVRSLAVTIRRVAGQVSVAKRSSVIRKTLGHPNIGTLVVIGYSCSDRFDITPAIKAIKNKAQPVVFVEHKNVSATEASVIPLSKVGEEHPFLGFNGVLLRCNTDDFVEELWRGGLQTKIPAIKQATHDWQGILQKWLDGAMTTRGVCIRPYVSAMLLREVGSYKASNAMFDAALRLRPMADMEAAAYHLLGNNHRDVGEYEEAIRFLRVSLELSHEHGFLQRQARVLSSLAMVMEDRKDHQRAIAYYKRAMRIARRIRDRELLGKCNGNTGIVYKNMGGAENIAKAIRYQENALRIARDIGDKRSEGRTLGNLGIAYSDLGYKERAIGYYQQAEAIARDLGDLRHIGIWLANSGMDYRGIDDSKSRWQLNRAIEIFGRMGLEHYVAECERYLDSIENPRTTTGCVHCAGGAGLEDGKRRVDS